MNTPPKILAIKLQAAIAEYVSKERERLLLEKAFLKNLRKTSPETAAVDKFTELFMVGELNEFLN